jgi:hypothetical protein
MRWGRRIAYCMRRPGCGADSNHNGMGEIMIQRILSGRLLAATVMALFMAGTASAQQPLVDSAYVWPKPTAADWQLIRGALDIHSHLDPDSAGSHSVQLPRALDVIDMAQQARAAGMRGFVIKQHYDQSAQLATIARKQVPGIEVFGGVGQNLTVGGLNAAAVQHMAEVQGGWGRIVWLPTWDAENHVLHEAKRRNTTTQRPFVRVSRDGVLMPETTAVLSAIAQAETRDSGGRLVLATGHLAPAEVLLVLREARQLGVRHMIVTHGIGDPVFMTIQQLQEAVKLGAMIEFVAAYAMGPTAQFKPDVYADAMRQVGVENVIISSDFGQVRRPSPPEGLAIFAGMMRREGFSVDELHRMMAVNPAKVLGLPPAQ